MNDNILFNLWNHARWHFMPGFDLFTRRRVRLCRHWLQGGRRVLDAGFGNGWFSYLAYRGGAQVTGVNVDRRQIDKAERFYNTWLRIPRDRLQFLEMNLNDIGQLEPGFDEIICYEVIEHMKDDAGLCRLFFRLLKPGGYLHLCAPYALHPRWKKEILHQREDGAHLRQGYTLQSYRSLLEPAGFKIVAVESMGGPCLTKISLFLEAIRNKLSDVWCLPFLPLALLLIRFDRGSEVMPYSLYVKAVKPDLVNLRKVSKD